MSNSKDDLPDSFDESVDDFQGQLIFREPKRIKLKAEQHHRKSSRLKNSSKQSSSVCIPNTSSIKDELAVEFLNMQAAACSVNEKICISCKAIVSCSEFSSHLSDCFKKFNCTSSKAEVRLVQKDDLTLPCPVCCKVLSSSSQRISHIKKCGMNHGLSTDKVLVAVRLQEKQAGERVALGLPPTVAVVSKTNEKKRKREDTFSPELELGYALSLSMVDKEEHEIANEEDKLVASGLSSLVLQKRRERAKLLDSEDMQVRIEKPKRKLKKVSEKTSSLLGTRTREERENILSEKLAELLLSEECFKRQPGFHISHSNSLHLISKDCRMWDMSSSCENKLKDYYVPELGKYIEPKFIEVGSFLKHLSQIPGRSDFTQIRKVMEDEDDLEDSTAYSDDPEKTLADFYSTQLALAELLGSQNFPTSPSPPRPGKLDRPMQMQTDCISNILSDYSNNLKCSVVSEPLQIMHADCIALSTVETSPTNVTDHADVSQDIYVNDKHSENATILKNSFTNINTYKNINSNEIGIKSSSVSLIKKSTVSIENCKADDMINNTGKDKCRIQDEKLCIQKADISDTQFANKIPITPNGNILPSVCSVEGVHRDKLLNSDKSPSLLELNFIYDWSKLLTSGNLSDVTIETAGGHISAHALVLHARCPPLSEEAKSNNIDWSSVDYDTAFLFLVYLYTGRCSINNDSNRNELLQIAVKYKCVDLVSFLQNSNPPSEFSLFDCSKLCNAKEPETVKYHTQSQCNLLSSSPDPFSDSVVNEEATVEQIPKLTDIYSHLHTSTTSKQSTSETPVKQVVSVERTRNEKAIYRNSPLNSTNISNLSCSSVSINNKSITRRRLYQNANEVLIGGSPELKTLVQRSAIVDLTLSDSNCSDNSEDLDCNDQGNQSLLSDEQYGNNEVQTFVDHSLKNVILDKLVLNERSVGVRVSGNLGNFVYDSQGNISTLVEKDYHSDNDYVNNVWDDFDDGGICGVQEITPYKSVSTSSTPKKLKNSYNSLTKKGGSPSVGVKNQELNVTTEDNIGDATLLHALIQTESDLTSYSEHTDHQSRKQKVAERFITPKNVVGKGQNITPMLSYKTMLTPQLKHELDKYGIRKLSRNKAIKLLVHIYDEMHPLVTDSEASFCDTPEVSAVEKVKHARPAARERSDTSSSSQSSLNSSSSNEAAADFETSLFGVEEDDDVDLSLTQKRSLKEQIIIFIKNDGELYKRILMYEPIWINELHKSLKEAGIKCSNNKLIDFLDEQCITFRYNQNDNKGKRKRGKKKVK